MDEVEKALLEMDDLIQDYGWISQSLNSYLESTGLSKIAITPLRRQINPFSI